MMKAFLLAVGFLGLTKGDVPKADYYYHQPILSPAMWVFGTDGIFIYNEDGTELKKHLPAEDICLPITDDETGETTHACAWRGVVSDGSNNVWATNSNAGSFVEVFNIDRGMHVASLPTCSFPWDVDFNPLRSEVWVHCWSPDEDEGDEGHIDVFSTASLSLDMKQIAIGELQVHGHGTVLADSSMPNIVYGNTLDAPILYEIDANTKNVTNQYEIPDVSGAFRMEFSHVNKHIFMRGYVCCSCGFEGSDLGEDCGRGSASYVDVIAGPNQATNVTGRCGHGCEGSPADVLGVLEWDTKSKKIVGRHLNSLGYAADPYIDPSGKYLIMLANDGGREATIIKTGQNGEPSKELAVIETGFSEEDGEKGIGDVCFIERKGYDVAIFISTLANFVVLADMRPLESGGTITVEKIWLTDDPNANVTSDHGRGARRNCAWAFDSPYVWVDAGKTEQVHILELHLNGDGTPTAKRIRDVSNVPSRLLAWVSNHERDAAVADSLAAASSSPSLPSSVTASAQQQQNSLSSDTTTPGDDDHGGSSNIAIIALVLSLLANVVVVVLFMKYNELQNLVKGNAILNGKESVPQPDKEQESVSDFNDNL